MPSIIFHSLPPYQFEQLLHRVELPTEPLYSISYDHQTDTLLVLVGDHNLDGATADQEWWKQSRIERYVKKGEVIGFLVAQFTRLASKPTGFP